MKAVLIFDGLGAELPAAGGNGSFNWAKRTYKTLSVIPVIPKSKSHTLPKIDQISQILDEQQANVEIDCLSQA